MSKQNELWVPVSGRVAGWPYEVSNFGSVRRVNGKRPFLIPKKDHGGYLRVNLHHNGHLSTESVHKLVASAFIGIGAAGLQVNHKNGDKCDNRPDNLEWLTCRENHLHAVRHGLRERMGAGHYQRKLTMREADAVRVLLRRGVTYGFLSRWFGISTNALYLIRKGATYIR